MSKVSFTNELLVTEMKAVAAAKGTRIDLVNRLLAAAGHTEPTKKERQQFYSNTTQRITSLTKLGVKLPALAKADKPGGGKRIDVAALNALVEATETVAS